MKPLHLNHLAASILAALFILYCTGCSKIETNYYADKDMPGLAIFSNKGNNLMTCFINGQPWQTIQREYGGLFGHYRTELQIQRIHTSSTLDTITITWEASDITQYDVTLTLPVAKNFTWKDFSSFSGKRIAIDSSNGYFSLTDRPFAIIKGKGNIYFNTAYIDSTGTTGIAGRISGLLDANFRAFNPPDFNITSGRFDDNITDWEVRNY